MNYFASDDMLQFWDINSDRSIDKGIALQRVFGPLPDRQPNRPPRIGVGEITSIARRDVGALELITRFREQQQRGNRPKPGGLAWYNKKTGLVSYAVVTPDQSGILWSGDIGIIPRLRDMTPYQREIAIRQRLTKRTGQNFRKLEEGHGGADLVPINRFAEFDHAIEEAIDYVITPGRRLFNCTCSIWGENPRCNALHRAGECAANYSGVGRNHAECMRNARSNAPVQCRGCLKHCGLRP